MTEQTTRDDRDAASGLLQEASDGDALEQQLPATPRDEDAVRSPQFPFKADPEFPFGADPEFPFEADPADAIEQQLPVPGEDEDDYR